MKIYTGFGDQGDTSLIGGEKVKKYDLRVEVYGTLDELNSILGIIKVKTNPAKNKDIIEYLQNDLFNISSVIACGKDFRKNIEFNKTGYKKLESFIDELSPDLPELKNFILPGGTEAAAFLHFARTVARRAERLLVKLDEKEKTDEEILIYLNRLSDLLFVMARYENVKTSKKEIFWQNNKK